MYQKAGALYAIMLIKSYFHTLTYEAVYFSRFTINNATG